jgi:hypothetical protein
MDRKITKINGPVSMHILEKGEVRFVLFGDIHFSKNFGCDDRNKIEMDAQRKNLTIKSINSYDSKTIDLNAAIHLWLIYNNFKSNVTDLFLECPLLSSDIPLITRSATFAKKDLLHEMIYMTEPCMKFKNKCPYGPNSRVHYADPRQYDTLGAIDPFTVMANIHISIKRGAHISVLRQYISVAKIILDNADNLWDAVCTLDGFHKFNTVKSDISALPRSNIRDSVLEGIDSMMTLNSSTREVNGKNVTMHKIALQNYKLYTNTPTRAISQANMMFFKEEFKTLV